MKNVNVTFRVDENLKAQADALFADLGMSLSTAFNIFFEAVSERTTDSFCNQPQYTECCYFGGNGFS